MKGRIKSENKKVVDKRTVGKKAADKKVVGGGSKPTLEKVEVKESPEIPLGVDLSLDDAEVELNESPIILLNGDVASTAFSYVYSIEEEICLLGTVERDGNVYSIDNFFCPPQVVSGSSTTSADSALDKEKMADWYCGLHEEHPETRTKLKVWLHSHPFEDLFWSRTDDSNIDDFISDWLVSLVLGDGLNIRARIDYRVPFNLTIDNVPVMLPLANMSSEVKDDVGDKVRKKKWSGAAHVTNYGGSWWGDKGESDNVDEIEAHCALCETFHSPRNPCQQLEDLGYTYYCQTCDQHHEMGWDCEGEESS